jgi:hypothetical protein
MKTETRHCPHPLLMKLIVLVALFAAGCGLSISLDSAESRECLLQHDYQHLPRPKLVGRRSHYREQFRKILTGFLAGTGDRYNMMLSSGKRRVLTDWLSDNGGAVNAHAIWLTRGFDESWVSRSDLEQMARQGIVPVLILYYFAQDISREHVLKHRKDWFFYLMKVAAIASIDYPVLIVLEPEFNDESNDDETLVISWAGFNEVVIDGIYILRSLAPNVLVGVCPGDFGDRQELELAAGEAIQYSDFVAFQEMRASTRPSLVNDKYEDLTERALAFSGRLHQIFDKPVLLAYTAVSTYNGDDANWTQYQADIMYNLYTAVPQLRANGVFGILNFMLFDDPEHEGWFEEAERYFGLVDFDGNPKSGWWVFKERLSSLKNILTRVKPPGK